MTQIESRVNAISVYVQEHLSACIIERGTLAVEFAVPCINVHKIFRERICNSCGNFYDKKFPLHPITL